MESSKLTIFSRTSGGENDKHFTKFSASNLFFVNETIHFENVCNHKPENRAGKLENYSSIGDGGLAHNVLKTPPRKNVPKTPPRKKPV